VFCDFALPVALLALSGTTLALAKTIACFEQGEQRVRQWTMPIW